MIIIIIIYIYIYIFFFFSYPWENVARNGDFFFRNIILFVLVRKMAYIRVAQIDWISLGKYLWNTNLKFI